MSNKKYLDNTGLATLVDNIKGNFATITEMTAPTDGEYIRTGDGWEKLSKLTLEDYSGDTTEYKDIF